MQLIGESTRPLETLKPTQILNKEKWICKNAWDYGHRIQFQNILHKVENHFVKQKCVTSCIISVQHK